MVWVFENNSWVPKWFNVPDGQCWTGGVPSLDGKCTYCGAPEDQHILAD